MERVGYRRMHDLSRISAPKFHFKSRIWVEGKGCGSKE